MHKQPPCSVTVTGNLRKRVFRASKVNFSGVISECGWSLTVSSNNRQGPGDRRHQESLDKLEGGSAEEARVEEAGGDV